MADRAVFDCMLFLQEAAQPARVRKSWEAVRAGELTLQLSDDIFEEITDVLNRAELREKFPSLTPVRVAAFITDVLARADFHTHIPPVYRVERDLDDSKYVNLAIACHAKYLVTRDNDLLDLVDEMSPEFQKLRALAPDLLIVTPEELSRYI